MKLCSSGNHYTTVPPLGKLIGQHYTPQQYLLTLNALNKDNNKQNKRKTKNHRSSTYKKHKLNDTLDIFHNQFCINEALAKIENNLQILPV